MLEEQTALTQVLAMIGREDRESRIQLAPLFDAVDQAPDLVVGVGHLGVVERAAMISSP